MDYFDEDFEDYDDFEDDLDDPCDRCGPGCPEWGGDGICMAAIRQQVEDQEEYEKNYVHPDYCCPVCGAKLTKYDVPVDDLWTWPGDFYNPMVAISFMGILPTPKGEIHRRDGIVHVWVGGGEYREEKLIHLTGKEKQS